MIQSLRLTKRGLRTSGLCVISYDVTVSVKLKSQMRLGKTGFYFLRYFVRGANNSLILNWDNSVYVSIFNILKFNRKVQFQVYNFKSHYE